MCTYNDNDVDAWAFGVEPWTASCPTPSLLSSSTVPRLEQGRGRQEAGTKQVTPSYLQRHRVPRIGCESVVLHAFPVAGVALTYARLQDGARKFRSETSASPRPKFGRSAPSTTPRQELARRAGTGNSLDSTLSNTSGVNTNFEQPKRTFRPRHAS